MAVAGEVERVGEKLLGFVVIGLGGDQLVLDVAELGGDAVLLALEEFEGDSTGVVGVEQLLALSGECGAFGVEVGAFPGAGGLEGVEVLEHEPLDAVAEFLAERDGAVLVLDEFLNRFDVHGLAVAAADAAGTARADHVVVDGAPLVGGLGEHEPVAAAAAEH